VNRFVRIAAAATALCAGQLPAAKLERDGWSLQPPPDCTVRAGHVAARPLYDAQARADLARDPMRILKPDYDNMPAHLRFDLDACYDPAGRSGASLRVLPVAEYRHILDDGRKSEGWVGKQFDALTRWLDGAPDAVADWPMVPFLDMSPQFTAQRRALRFRGGRGIRVVTQFVPDVGFATSGIVRYVFQGLSDDGRDFVLLTVPLTIDGAAADDAPEHLGFTLDQLEGDADAARRYEQAVAALIAKQGTRPALAELDALVESLVRESAQTTHLPTRPPQGDAAKPQSK
jgi:hypothetical protein